MVFLWVFCGRYESGDRLSQEHERTIVDRLLAYHPVFDNKIGSGIDYITVMAASLSLFIYYRFDSDHFHVTQLFCVEI